MPARTSLRRWARVDADVLAEEDLLLAGTPPVAASASPSMSAGLLYVQLLADRAGTFRVAVSGVTAQAVVGNLGAFDANELAEFTVSTWPGAAYQFRVSAAVRLHLLLVEEIIS